MNTDIFLAILAMDSYNRGYEPGINGLPFPQFDSNGNVFEEVKLGQAKIITDSSVELGLAATQNAGFYAIAYDVSAVTGFGSNTNVVSYRGLDSLWADLSTFMTALGSPTTPQAELAVSFLRSALNLSANDDPRNAAAIMTGSSLGGGLAGYVSALYGLGGVLFDPIPFHRGTDTAYLWSQPQFAAAYPGLKESIYGAFNPWLPSYNQISGYYIPTQDDDKLSNAITTLRNLFSGENQNLLPLGLPMNVDLSLTPDNLAGERHSTSLQIILMYGNQSAQTGTFWDASAKYIVPMLFDQSIGASIVPEAVQGSDSLPTIFRSAIAYSAIDEGERPFGDIGIRALFNDANDFGKFLPNIGSSDLRFKEDAIARYIVQFAGKMALGDVEGNDQAKEGVLAVNSAGNVLSINAGDNLWQLGSEPNGDDSIRLGLTDLVRAPLEAIGFVDVKQRAGEGFATKLSEFVPSDVDYRLGDALNLLTVDLTSDISNISRFDASIFDRFNFVSSNAGSVTLDDRKDGGTGLALTIGTGGSDQISGATDNDVIVTGAGNDILAGGGGVNFLYGGGGTDTVDYSAQMDGRISINLDGAFFDELLRVDGPTDSRDYILEAERIIGTDFADIIDISSLFYLPPIEYIDLGGNGLEPNFSDTVDASHSDHGVTIDLRNSQNQLAFATGAGGSTGIVIRNAEAAVGSDFSDNLFANDAGSWLEGGDGADNLYGGQGNDVLIAHRPGGASQFAWNDILQGGGGADYLKDGSDMTGGAGNDVIDATGTVGPLGAIVRFAAGDGHDTIKANSHINYIDLSSLSASDISVVWDVDSLTLLHHDSDGSFYNVVADLAVVINSTGDSIVIRGFEGEILVQGWPVVSNISSVPPENVNSIRFFGHDILLSDGLLEDVNSSQNFYQNGNFQFGPVTPYDLAESEISLTSTPGAVGHQNMGDQNGTSGDDNQSAEDVSSTGGDVTVDGGAGNDTVSIAGGASSYYVTSTGAGILLTANSGLPGTITLQNVETVRFRTSVKSIATADLVATVGDNSANILAGTGGNDTIIAYDGDDNLTGGAGDDQIDGGAGVDTVYYSGQSTDYRVGYDLITDAIVVEDLRSGSVTFALAAQTLSTQTLSAGSPDGTDLLSNVEQIQFAGDSIMFDIAADIPVFTAASQSGFDMQYTGTDRADYVVLTPQVDWVDTGAGDDVILSYVFNDYAPSIDLVDGGQGNDLLKIIGYSYDYSFTHTANGIAVFSKSAGQQFAELAGVESIYFSGDDLTVQAAQLVQSGTAAADILGGTRAGDALSGLDGNDYLNGGAGDDYLVGGTGDDVMSGGAGSDSFILGANDAGDDVIEDFGPVTDFDTLVLEGTTEADVTVRKLGNDLLIERLDSTGAPLGTVTVTNQFDGTGSGLEDISFDYSADWDRQTIDSMTSSYVLTPQDDQISGAVEDTAFIIDPTTLLANDQIVGATGVALTSVQSVSGGIATLLGDGSISFDGDPDFSGNAYFDYTLTDSLGYSATARVEVQIQPVNDTPVSLGAIADQQVDVGLDLLLVLPFDQFVDPDADDSLTITATLADGSALPSWLGFYAESGVFFGTPTTSDTGNWDIRLSAVDGSGASVSEVFTVTVAGSNTPPTVSGSVSDQSTAEDAAYSFTLPAGLFSDVDAGDSLTLAITQADGSALPTWLSYDPATQTLSGTPLNGDVGALALLVTATDLAGASVSTGFNLTVTNVNDAPVVSAGMADAAFDEDTPVDLLVPQNAFADEDGDALTLSATLSDGTALPSWLSFDGQRFTGTPPTDFSGSYDIQLTASDGAANVSTNFMLTINPVNDAPVVASLLPDVASPEDTVISFTLPAGSFTDVDNGTLTYAAALIDGSALPSWLSFDAAAQQFTGTPPADYNGFVDVRVTASDGSLSAFDDFRLTIMPVNDAPVTSDISDTVQAGSTATGSVTASDVDGDTLSYAIGTGPAHGTASVDAATGAYSYTPTATYAGADSFTVQVSDGNGGLVSSTVSFSVTASGNVINGTPGNDSINGTPGNDIIYGYAGSDGIYGNSGDDVIDAGDGNDQVTGDAGNDTIFGGAGSDGLYGGSGDDTIDGGDGNDLITGDDGNDVLIGGLGSDQLYAGAGNDSLDGGDGNDVLTGDAGDDTMMGGAGSDQLYGGAGNDSIDGGDGDDFITGDAGADILTGGNGNDQVYGGNDNDVIDGGAGNDTLTGDGGDDIIAPGSGNDNVYAGSGIDTLSYAAMTSAWTINLSTNSATSGAETDGVYDFENAIGGSGNDVITGTSASNILDGGAGDDRLKGGAGNDTIIGGAGTNDVAVFAGLQSSYTIATNNGVVTITDNQSSTDGNDGVDTVSGIEIAEFKGGVQVGISSPIVLDLDGDGVDLIDRDRSSVRFDWDGDGTANRTGWVGRNDGFLVYDRNHDGKVSSTNELSFLDDKPAAKSDLDGLTAFDSNGDGFFSAEDEAFEDFRIWKDANGNGKSDRGELMSLEDAGIASLTLAGTAVNREWDWSDNITINTGSFTRTDGSAGAFSDVALNYESEERGSSRSRFGFDDDDFAKKRFSRFSDTARSAGQLAEAIAAFGAEGGGDIIKLHDMEERRELLMTSSHASDTRMFA